VRRKERPRERAQHDGRDFTRYHIVVNGQESDDVNKRPSGKVLIREGAPGREFIVILEGTVEVRRKGRRLPQAGDSSFFGEAALLTGAPRNATVTTTSPVATLIITDRAFQRLLKASPTIQGKTLTALATRLATD
jgi:CRP-like cAMP-binding protein